MVALLGCGGAAPLTGTSSIDDVLDAMHDRGGDLKAFTADVTQRQEDQMGGVVTYGGHVWFQTLPDGDARLHLVLDTKQKGNHKPVPSKHEYLLDKGVLTDRDYPIKNESRRQVVQPGQKLDLFQLGKGPFPLPIGQDKRQVLQQFDVKRMPGDKDDPPNTIHLQLTPKPGSQFARQFKTVDFWVDTVRRMPVRIETFDGANDQTNDLTNLTVNPAVGDADFTLKALDDSLPPTDRKWTSVDVPYGQ